VKVTLLRSGSIVDWFLANQLGGGGIVLLDRLISLTPERRKRRLGHKSEIGPLVGQRGRAYNPRLCCDVIGKMPDAEISLEFGRTTEG
jgi:hypothetical protein